MKDTQIDALARAIDYLGAVEVAPGRYALLGSTPERGGRGCWYTCDADALLSAQIGKLALMKRVLMPAWWSPKQRFAWRCKGIFRLHDAHVDPRPYCKNAQRITADLETGVEVPA